MRGITSFIFHPRAGEVYTLTEAARIIGIHYNTLQARIARGDTGWQLWRPSGTKASKIYPGEPVDTECFVASQDEKFYK